MYQDYRAFPGKEYALRNTHYFKKGGDKKMKGFLLKTLSNAPKKREYSLIITSSISPYRLENGLGCLVDGDYGPENFKLSYYAQGREGRTMLSAVALTIPYITPAFPQYFLNTGWFVGVFE